MLGAQVFGYALDPPTDPSLCKLAGVDELVASSTRGDIRDLTSLTRAMEAAEPEVVIHMAAQPIVRESYLDPVKTYETNVMGAVNLMEALRSCPTVKAAVNVTTDKVYENKEWERGYVETDSLGGYDPYSSSKGCSEMVTLAYRNSFFNPADYKSHGKAVATVRAGNVIGGGDWAKDRLIPDCVRALLKDEPIAVRNPQFIRPFQYVLEPLRGYLTLARKLCEDGPQYGEAWNFGPDDSDARPVQWMVEKINAEWSGAAGYSIDDGVHPHEDRYLKLACGKAKERLGWRPWWGLETTLRAIVMWTKVYRDHGDVRAECLRQIAAYWATGEEIES
jgi:CDP-glucose 4,6-dehydratase